MWTSLFLDISIAMAILLNKPCFFFFFYWVFAVNVEICAKV